MQILLKILDGVWNAKALIGIRTQLFRYIGIGLTAYQALATDTDVMAIFDLPDIPVKLYAAILGWIVYKVPQFSKEHKSG